MCVYWGSQVPSNTVSVLTDLRVHLEPGVQHRRASSALLSSPPAPLPHWTGERQDGPLLSHTRTRTRTHTHALKLSGVRPPRKEGGCVRCPPFPLGGPPVSSDRLQVQCKGPEGGAVSAKSVPLSGPGPVPGPRVKTTSPPDGLSKASPPRGFVSVWL